MRDNSISRALPRARAAAEQFERRYVQLAIACLPAGACCGGPSEKNVPGRPFRGLLGSKNGCLGTLIYLPLHANPSRATADPACGCFCVSGHAPAPPAPTPLVATPPAPAPRTRSVQKGQLPGRDWPSNCPSCTFFGRDVRSWRSPRHRPSTPLAPCQKACKKGSCRVEIDPTTAQVAHSLGETCGRGAPRDIRQSGRARVGEPVCAGLDQAGSNPSPVTALRRPAPARGHDVAV